MLRVLAALLVGLALLAGTADARLTVNNLSSFGARRVSVGGGAGGLPVFESAAAYNDTNTNGASGAFEFSYTATHTKDVDATFVLIGIQFSSGNTWTHWPTDVGMAVSYCGSTATYVTGSLVDTSDAGFADGGNAQMITWWWLRGPSAGACTVQFNLEGSGAGGTGTNFESSPDVEFLVEEFSLVKSSGTPYEGVTTAQTTGTTGSITLTPATATVAVWGAARDGSTTIGTGPPTVDFGSVDANIASGNSYHSSSGRYDAAGAKTITLTWGAGVSRLAALSGLHLLP